MKSLFGCLVVASAAVLGASAPAVVTGNAPFYVEQTESSIGGASKAFIVAQQADGTTVRIESGGSVAVRDVFLTDGRAVSIFDKLKLKAAWPATTRRQGVEAHPSPDCNVEVVDDVGQPTDRTLGLESVLGEVVVVSETIYGDYTITSWRAPRLACEELYYRSEKNQRDGTKTLAVEMRTTRLVFGDPDAQLFTINPAFRDVTPSEKVKSLVSENGLPLPDDERERLVRDQAKSDRRD